MQSLWNTFDAIISLDTETSGLGVKAEIIEFGGVCYTRGANAVTTEAKNLDVLIRLPGGQHLGWKITQITGLTDDILRNQGIDKKRAAEAISQFLATASRPLIVAYNAQFDLPRLYYLLKDFQLDAPLRRAKFLDVMTVYRDRRPKPHTLEVAITAYAVHEKNTHRAMDDARAAFRVLEAMGREKDDLAYYIGLFGYLPRFGRPNPRIASIDYRPQPSLEFIPERPLYENS